MPASRARPMRVTFVDEARQYERRQAFCVRRDHIERVGVDAARFAELAYAETAFESHVAPVEERNRDAGHVAFACRGFE